MEYVVDPPRIARVSAKRIDGNARTAAFQMPFKSENLPLEFRRTRQGVKYAAGDVYVCAGISCCCPSLNVLQISCVI